jgi:TolA-binding protein
VWPDQGLANRIAQELIPRLLAQKNNSESFNLARKRLAADRDFRPRASTDLIRLATLARDVGDRATARALLREFDRFFPNDPQRAMADELVKQVQR